METKTKQKWRKDCKIEIETLLDITENPKGVFNNKEKLINVEIDKHNTIASSSFPYTKKGKKEALQFIKEEAYL